MKLAKAALLVALVGALAGWLGLSRAAAKFLLLPGRGVPLAELGWPDDWNQISKVLVLPGGSTALVVLGKERAASACRLDLTSGRLSHCVELELGSQGRVVHAHASGHTLIASWHVDPLGGGEAALLNESGLVRRVTIADGWSVTNVAWDGPTSRFVLAQRSTWHGALAARLTFIPLDGGQVVDESDPLMGAALGRWGAFQFEATFPDGTTVFHRGERSCLAGGGRLKPNCDTPRAERTVWIGSHARHDFPEAGPDDLWVDARGKETPLLPAFEGFLAPLARGCDSVIRVYDDGSEQPRMTCMTPDAGREARLFGKTERFVVLEGGGEHVLALQRAGGQTVKLARDVRSSEHISVIDSDIAVLVLAGGAIPLTPTLEPRAVTPLRERVTQILRRRWAMAPYETAAFLSALGIFPPLALASVRVLRRAKRALWPALLMPPLVLILAFAWVTLTRFAEFAVPP